MIYSDWLIAFYDPPPDRWRWWHNLTRRRPGFGHVLAMGYDTIRDTWLILDWTHEKLSLCQIPDGDFSTFIAGLTHPDSNGRVLRLPDDWQPTRLDPWIWPCLSYCVTQVKHLIGLRDFSLTPYQLFCALRAKGATEIFTTSRAAWVEANEAV